MHINSPILLARMAGLTYVILILSGVFGIASVPASLIQWADPAATIVSIKNSEALFRLAITSQLICFISFILLPFLLYKLLASVSPTAGFFMLAFSLVSVPVLLVSVVCHVNVLHLIGDSPYLQQFSKEAIQLQVMQSLALSNNCATVTNIFAGLWLFPFGYLVIKCGLLPRILGYLLILGCLGYLYEFVAGFILELGSSPWYVGLAGNLGVFAIALWLLVLGVRKQNESYESI